MRNQTLYVSGSQTRGRDPFEGRQILKKGRQNSKFKKLYFFVLTSQKKDVLLKIFLHLKGDKTFLRVSIFKHSFFGSPIKKVWEPLLYVVS